MPEDINGKLGLDTTDWKTGVSQINRDVRTIESGFKAVAAGMDDWRKSADGLKLRNSSLTEEVGKQKEKVALLESEYQRMKNAAEESGDTTASTAAALQDFQIRVNKAKEELAKSETALRKNSDALEEMKRSGGDGVFAKIAEHIKPSKENILAFTKGILDCAKALGSNLLTATKNVASAVGKTFVSALKGAAAGAAALATAAGGLAVKIGKEVVKAFGELEQNLGGSEAVFGKYASSIQKSGEEAYKNLGVSQSSYLATANKMGALFQGTGMEQQKSLELTEKAMQRAADMASVMGIDTSAALEAVTGAAKGNYTMMDNLGVAMNETSLKAYLLSSGMAKNEKAANKMWQSMSQAEKTEVAMQMFFENTQQYAGNFAKEASETVSGSMGLLKASIESFVAGLGNAGADMTNLTQNVTDAFVIMVGNVMPVLQNVVASIPTAFAAVAPAITEILPTLIDAAVGLFTSILNTLVSLLPQLIPVAVEAITTIVTALIENLPMLLTATMQLVSGLASGIMDAIPQLIPVALELIMSFARFLVDNLPSLLDSAAKIIGQIIDGITALLPELVPMAISIMVQIATALIGAIPQIAEKLPEIVNAIITGLTEVDWISTGATIISGVISGLLSVGESLLSAVGNIISTIWDGIVNTDWLSLGSNLINGIVDGMGNLVETVKTKVTGFFSNIWSGVKSFFGIHSPSTVTAEDGKMIMEGFRSGAENAQPSVLDKVKGVFSGIWDGIKSIFGFGGSSNESAEAKKTGKEVTTAVAEGISGGGEDAKKAVKTTAQTIVDMFKSELGTTSGSSTKTKPFGEGVVKGIVDGFTAQKATAENEVKVVCNAITQAIVASWGTASGSSTITKPYGQAAVKGIADGITLMSNQAVNSTKLVANTLVNTLRDTLGARGESSSVSKPYGRSLAQGAIDGLKAMTNSLKSAAQSVGSAISSGIAQGIRNGASAINDAARTAAANALAAAKRKLGIHSPSKVAADELGLPFMQGIAKGITANMGVLTDSMKNVTSSLTKKATSIPPVSIPSTAVASAGVPSIVSAVLQLGERQFGQLVVELADVGQGFAASNQQRYNMGVQLI